MSLHSALPGGPDRRGPTPRPAARRRRLPWWRFRGAASSEPLGWRSLTPAISIAAFVAVAVFSIDGDGSARVGLALVAAVPLGVVISYLCATYWPGARPSGDRASAPPPPETADADDGILAPTAEEPTAAGD